jgi:DNA-binding CsgD family transcriptional regulator
MGFPAHSVTPSERAALLAAEHDGAAFLAYRDGLGDLRLVPIESLTRLTIGRTTDNDVVLDGDPQVSRAHAVLERIGGGWAVHDDGMSRNGSYVNGERVLRHRRLEDDDMLRIGTTSILFRCPAPPLAGTTIAASSASAARLTQAERRVLVGLCRPLLAPGMGATPASNREIADELVLSLSGVKTHIRSLFAKLGVDDLPQNRKRAQLARRALETGLVTTRDLDP